MCSKHSRLSVKGGKCVLTKDCLDSVPTDIRKLDLWDAGVHCDGVYRHTKGKFSRVGAASSGHG